MTLRSPLVLGVAGAAFVFGALTAPAIARPKTPPHVAIYTAPGAPDATFSGVVWGQSPFPPEGLEYINYEAPLWHARGGTYGAKIDFYQ